MAAPTIEEAQAARHVVALPAGAWYAIVASPLVTRAAGGGPRSRRARDGAVARDQAAVALTRRGWTAFLLVQDVDRPDLRRDLADDGCRERAAGPEPGYELVGPFGGDRDQQAT